MSIEFINDGFKTVSRRERIIKRFGKYPLLCPKCGEEMLLWRIWHPRYGTISDFSRDGPFENVQKDNADKIAGSATQVMLAILYIISKFQFRFSENVCLNFQAVKNEKALKYNTSLSFGYRPGG